MKLIAFLLCLFFTVPIMAQDSFVKERKQLLQEKIDDTTRARIYSELAEHILEEEVWLDYNQKALDLANKKLKKAKGDERKFYLNIKANSVGNQGFYEDEHGNIKKALDFYFEALNIYDEAGNVKDKATIYNNVGLIFSHQKDFDDALDYLNRALELKLKYYPDKVSKNYLNLGSTSEYMGDSLRALNYYHKALEAALKVRHNIDIATANHNIGSYYFSQKEFDKAIPYFHKALYHYGLENDDYSEAWTMANMSSCFMNMGEMDSTSYYIIRAQELAKQFDMPKLNEIVAERLYNYHRLRGDYKEALENYELSVSIRDSLNNAGIQKDALRKKLEYDYTIDKTKRETQRQEEKKREKQRFFFILIGLIMAVIFMIIIYLRLRVIRKQSLIIDAQRVETEIQKNIIEENSQKILDSITSAKRLQDAILPEVDELINAFPDAMLLYLPKDIVAGDFYWIHKESDDVVYVAAADCTGHGVPGALVSVICSHALDTATLEYDLTDTGEILDKVRELVIERFGSNDEVKNGMDIALCRVDLKSRKVQFSGAYNPLWIKRKNAEGIEVIKGDRQPVGNFVSSQPFSSHMVQLEEGDWFYMFSDGYADQFGGPKGKKFKPAALQRLFLEHADKVGEQQYREIERRFDEWRGDNDQIDDICILGVKI